MPVPDIFSDDPPTERLASYFEELYEYLLDQGVPEECLPSPWHVLRRVTKAIDHELMREWLDAYASVEAEAEADEDEDDGAPKHRHRPQKRPRPSYLRALEPDDAKQEDPGHDDDEEPASGEEST